LERLSSPPVGENPVVPIPTLPLPPGQVGRAVGVLLAVRVTVGVEVVVAVEVGVGVAVNKGQYWASMATELLKVEGAEAEAGILPVNWAPKPEL
jgi:hypothetical protein